MSDTSPDPLAPRLPAPSAQPPVPAPPPLPVPGQPSAFPPPPVMPMGMPGAMAVPTTRGMYTAAAILNWITLAIIIVATLGIGVIAAAWFVPMTILIHKAAKGPYKHTALGVCTLLFCNIISGILMLVDDSNRPPKPLV